MIQTANRLNSVEEYYFSQKLREVRELVNQGKPVINMGIGSPDLPPAPQVVQALANSMDDATAHQYQSYQGLPALRMAMSQFYERHFRVLLDPDSQILPLLGSKEGIMHISLAFLNPGDKVLIPNPGYPSYASVANLVGAVPVFYDLLEEKHWEPDFEWLSRQDLSGVKLMWVNYPNMPTGANGSRSLFIKLVAFARANDILLVNDNPYGFILNEDPRSLLEIDGASNVAIELNSLSKTFNLSGWRIGMVLGNKAFIDAILKVKSNMDSGMFYGIQKGAIAALELPDQWFSNLNAVYRKRRELVFQLAELLKCTFDRGTSGMFVWAKLPENEMNAEDFVDRLLYEKHIFITPGSIFGSQGKHYIRFSLCVPEDKIIEAISRFESATKNINNNLTNEILK